ELRPVYLGPLRIQPFGATVACALITWLALILGRARGQGLDPRRALRLFECVLITGFIGAVLAGLARHPFSYSSFGGAFGALVGAWLGRPPGLPSARSAPSARGQAWMPTLLWRYLDLLAFAFPFGWAFLRLGCTLVHDHPGKPTTSWLAVQYPNGPRYDLG